MGVRVESAYGLKFVRGVAPRARGTGVCLSITVSQVRSHSTDEHSSFYRHGDVWARRGRQAQRNRRLRSGQSKPGLSVITHLILSVTARDCSVRHGALGVLGRHPSGIGVRDREGRPLM